MGDEGSDSMKEQEGFQEKIKSQRKPGKTKMRDILMKRKGEKER